MKYCIICGGRISDCRCPRCGFDLSLSREDYPTLSADCPPGKALWTLRDALYRKLQQGEAPGEPRTSKLRFGTGIGPVRPGEPQRDEPLGREYFLVRPNENGSCTITGLAKNCGASLNIPAKIDGMPVTEIGTKAFSGRHAIVTVTLPKSLVCVRPFAFYGCKSLQKVRLPDGVELWGKAFGSCGALSNVIFDRGGKDHGRTSCYLAEDAFSGHRPEMNICARPGSAAAEYAKRMGIRLRSLRNEI